MSLDKPEFQSEEKQTLMFDVSEISDQVLLK